MPSFGQGALRRRRHKWAHSPVAPSRLGGGERGGGAFLPDLFGGVARQWVEMAFGADLTADPDTWSWTEVTTYFLWESGINTSIGRPPESTRITPATFSGTIRNDQPNGGDWTVGNALSPRWPNVRENTPVRARLDVGSGPTVRFQGYAVSFTPDTLAVNDAGDRISVVRFKAAGVARRVLQGASAPQSPMWRFHMLAYRYDPSTVTSFMGTAQGYHMLPNQYWPMEESYGALRVSNAIDVNSPMTAASFAELPSFSSGTIGTGSKSLPLFSVGSSMRATFPAVAMAPANLIRIPFLFRIPAQPAALAKVITVGTTGTVGSIILTVQPTGADTQFFLSAYDQSGVLIGATSGFNDTPAVASDVYLSLEPEQVGADVKLGLAYSVHSVAPEDGIPVGSIVSRSVTLAGQTITGITSATFAPDADLDGVTLGHLAVYAGAVGDLPVVSPRAVRARTGDPVDVRLRRLSIENDVPLDLVGTADLVMGVQGIGGYLDLMGECETVDQGLLLDGLGPGLTYVCRTHAYSQAAGLTLDAAAGQVLRPLPTEHDDLGRVNTFTASNPAGGEATFTKEAGDISAGEVGVYDSSGDYRVALDSTLYDEAAWRVHLGTVPGLRYPGVSFQLAKEGTAPLAQQWLDTRPMGRLDVLDLQPGTVDPDGEFLLRSWRERWTSLYWSVTASLSPYAPWGIATLADDTGDDGEFLFRPAGGYSTVVDAVEPGATTFDVATSSGPVWTTTADDIDGLYVEVSGLRVAVTNITGATSPQTFTVDGSTVLKAIPAGTAIDVWQAPALGL